MSPAARCSSATSRRSDSAEHEVARLEHGAITPDIVTFGKWPGAGLPISAAVGPAAVLDEPPPASALLATAGNPYSTAVARAVLATIEAEGLVERARAAGLRLQQALRQGLDHLHAGGELFGPRPGGWG